MLGSLKRALPTVRIVTATAPEQWDFLSLGPRPGSARGRIVRMNHATRALAAAHDAAVLDAPGTRG